MTDNLKKAQKQARLVAQAEEKGANTTALQPYFNFFKHGCPPHGGYGFGLTRMLMNLLEIENVREVTFVYRGVNRITP